MFEIKDDTWQRAEMVEKQLRRRGIRDPAVLAAMLAVPRHEFVPGEFRARAYDDVPLPIGGGQTISQPYIVAAMTLALRPQTSDRALEIGTGCGYQAAVLSLLAKEVFTIERQPELAPVDTILVAAAAPAAPEPLLAQLAELGRMIIPVGDADSQELRLIEKHAGAFSTKTLEGCRFVPLVGHHSWQKPPER